MLTKDEAKQSLRNDVTSALVMQNWKKSTQGIAKGKTFIEVFRWDHQYVGAIDSAHLSLGLDDAGNAYCYSHFSFGNGPIPNDFAPFWDEKIGTQTEGIRWIKVSHKGKKMSMTIKGCVENWDWRDGSKWTSNNGVYHAVQFAFDALKRGFEQLAQWSTTYMMNSLITTLTGSLLDNGLAEGIALFIPQGLTSFRVDARKFFERECWNKAIGACTVSKSVTGGKAWYLICIDNAIIKINNVDDMKKQVWDVLDIFASHGIRTVAMNGIRCDNRPDLSVRPEKYQRQFVEEYLSTHPDVFDKIILVDARGGFDKKE